MLPGTPIGEGKRARVYQQGNRAFKLFPGQPSEYLWGEALLQAFAAQAGLPVPQIYGIHTLTEGAALEMDCITGWEMTALAADDARLPDMLRNFVRLQVRIHEINPVQVLATQDESSLFLSLYDQSPFRNAAPECSPLTIFPSFAGSLREKLMQPAVTAAVPSLLLIDLLGRLERLDKGQGRLCHGDYHPSNVLWDADGRLWVIDWPNAAAGDPEADACRTYLILLRYAPALAESYLRLYCGETARGEKTILDWLPLLAAARLTEELGEAENAFLWGLIC